MTLLDDDIDDLLQAFRADEARVDDLIRSRIWARVCDAAPDAPTALDTLDRGARVRRLRSRVGARPRARVLAVAAAVLVLLAVAGLAVRSGPNDGDVVAGAPTTLPLPRTLDELADRVAVLPVPVLGAPGARYTYRQGVHSVRADASSARVVRVEQQWIAADGSGRRIIDTEGDDAEPDERTGGPGTFTVGLLPPSAVVDLPDDADIVLATFERETGLVVASSQTSPRLIEILTYTGLPGPARAGVLRALDRLGFVPVPGADLAPNVWRVEGQGPDGSTMQADLDLRTGEVIATARSLPSGGFDRLTSIEVDLRRDTHGS